MPQRESWRSLRVRWNLPPAEDHITAYIQHLPPTTRYSTVPSASGNTASLTATFLDKKARDDAYELARESFKDATVDYLFDGITVLKSVPQPQLEVCAVHGLGGSAVDSFTARTRIWLRDLLPGEAPFDTARISTFGYTSGIWDQESTDRLSDWADYLLEAISRLRVSTKTTDLPIVFVCHSMGGLVVRTAMEHLFQYASSQKYASIPLHKCAVLFLATPHDGTTEVEYNEFLTEILRSWFSLRKDLITDELRSLNDSAARSKRVWETMDQLKCTPPIECLAESRVTRLGMFKSAILVQQSSAGFNGKFANKVPDVDHMQISKFEDMFSPGFNMVVTRLQALYQALLARERKSFAMSPVTASPIERSTYQSIAPLYRGTKRKVQELELTINEKNHFWIVSRPINSHFTGRKEDLKLVEEAIINSLKPKDSFAPRRYVITGMGGYGKSELCLRIAQDLRQRYAHNLKYMVTNLNRFWGVFWIDVASQSTAEAGYVHIAKTLGNESETLEDACLFVSNLKQPWLLILDNADEPYYDYNQVLPAGNSGVVLVTSRNAECSQYATIGTLALSGLDQQDAQQLLLKMVKAPAEQAKRYQKDADRVAATVGYHTLAMLQAGSYVARGHCSLQDYPQVFETHKRRLLQFKPTQAQSRYGDVYATFEASAQKIEDSDEQDAKDALDLLYLLSLMECAPVPLSIFQTAGESAYVIINNKGELGTEVDKLSSWHVDKMIPLAKPDKESWDSFRLLEACHLLQSLALATTETNSGSVGTLSLHPLTHAWAQERQSPAMREKSWIMCSTTNALGLQKESGWLQLDQQLKPHLRNLITGDLDQIYQSSPHLEITRIFYTFGKMLSLVGDEWQVHSLLLNIIKQLDLDTKITSAQWLPLYELIGRTLSATRQIDEAIVILEQVTSFQEDRAENDPARLRSQQALAVAYRQSGQLTKSIELLEKVIELRDSRMEDDEEQVEAYYHMGLACAWQRKPQEDLRIIQKAFENRKFEDGSTSLDVKMPEGLVNINIENIDQFDQAKRGIKILEQILKAVANDRPKNDPLMLSVKHALARTYRHNGQWADARVLLEEVLNSDDSSESNRVRLGWRGELCVSYFMASDYSRAVEEMEDVHQIRAKYHPWDTRAAWRNITLLAFGYEALGQGPRAFETMQNALAIKNKSIPDPFELQESEGYLRLWMQRYQPSENS